MDPVDEADEVVDRRLGDKSHMTSAKLWDFWTPSPLVTVLLTQPISTTVKTAYDAT